MKKTIIASALLSALSFNVFAVTEANINWTQLVGGSSNEDYSDVISISDGSAIMVGSTSSQDGDITTQYNGGASDALITKLDENGNVLWNILRGGSGADKFHAIAQMSDGSFVAVGESQVPMDGLSPERKEGLMVSFLDNGEVLWEKRLNSDDRIFASLEDISNIPETGEYFVTGTYYNAGKNTYYGQTMKFAGEELKSTVQEELTSNSSSPLIAVDESNTYSYFQASSGPYGDTPIGNTIVKAVDSEGEVVWEYNLDGKAVALDTTLDNGLLVTTQSQVLKLSSTGQQEWSHYYNNGKIYASTSFQDAKEIYIGDEKFHLVAGKFLGYGGPVSGLIRLLDKNGQYISAEEFQSNSSSSFNAISVDVNNDVLFTGYSDSTGGDITDPHNGGRDGLTVNYTFE
ncbi:exported hypothetical protein [Vibrio owensii]|uniref:Uncharacterized protein n=1 Tax=Vibrio owensii TaxID=696485 RepID=A0AAU9Q9Z4_9VIBR|nr:exported hypothetical protein [Vibrio owensii]